MATDSFETKDITKDFTTEIFGFTREMLVGFRTWIDENKSRPSFTNYSDDVDRFLSGQEDKS